MNKRIREIKKSIKALEKIKNIYNEEVCLCGAFVSDMFIEIDLQIEHCNEILKNINENINGN